jgi:hypothetical protein
MLDILTYPEHPINLKLCEIARHKLRGMVWDDCDKGGGREDKARDQEEGGSRGCAGNCYFGQNGQILAQTPCGSCSAIGEGNR